MDLEEVQKLFPIGAQVSYLMDDGGESDEEWNEIGIVQEYIPTYFGGEVLGYYSIKVYNSSTKRFHNAHVRNTELTKEYIRKTSFESLLDE